MIKISEVKLGVTIISSALAGGLVVLATTTLLLTSVMKDRARDYSHIRQDALLEVCERPLPRGKGCMLMYKAIPIPNPAVPKSGSLATKW